MSSVARKLGRSPRWKRKPRVRRGRRARFTFDDGELVAIVDTNVLLDIFSCHDVRTAQDESKAKCWYRLERAAYALRTAIYLHDSRAVTLSAGYEALELATKRVPPDVNDINRWFLQTWFLFTKPRLLRNWLTASEPIVGTGNAVDDALVALAQKHGRPLVSNEGLGPTGIDASKGLLVKAAAAGVTVLTPQQFCGGKVTRSAIEGFMNKFVRVAPCFCRGHRLYGDVQRMLQRVYDYYGKLLEGTEPSGIAYRAARVTTSRHDH